MLRVVSNEALVKAERQQAEESQATPATTGLQSFIKKRWEAAQAARAQGTSFLPSYDRRMLDCLRARQGVYTPEVEAEIAKIGGSKVYARLTDSKARTCQSWLTDIFLSQDRPWLLKPTPSPALPIDLTQGIAQLIASEVAELAAMGMPIDETAIRMRAQKLKDQAASKAYETARIATLEAEKKLDDQLVEGGFYDELRSSIGDFVTFPITVIAGPFVEIKTKLVWRNNKAVAEDHPTFVFRRVNPLDLYPCGSSTHISDNYLVELITIRRDQMESWRDLPDYDRAAINETLLGWDSIPSVADLGVSTTRRALEGKLQMPGRDLDTVEGLNFWGRVPGQQLLDWGLSKEDVSDPFKSYPINAISVNGLIIYVKMNPDPLGRLPYFLTSYEKVPGSLTGNALYEVLKDLQDSANSTLRSLLNNQAISSGPQVGINVNRLAPEEMDRGLAMVPWRQWLFQDDPLSSDGNKTPITFFQPQSNAESLLRVYQYFMSLADDISGIPRYMAGGTQDLSAVGRTSSGMGMLMSHATKAMKLLAQNIETDIIVPILERLYMMNLLYNPDFPQIADAQIVARGASGLILKDAMQARRSEFLASTANPIDVGLVGAPQRAKLLREGARELGLPVDDVVPSEEDLMRQVQAMQENSGGQGPQKPKPRS